MFQTKVDILPSDIDIAHKHTIMTFGSCFSENIGKKLHDAFFMVDVNPFGVLFNPLSVSNSIRLLLQNKTFTDVDIFRQGSMWNSFSHSSLFSDITLEACLSEINERVGQAVEHLRQTDFLLITFGTAWVFEDVHTHEVVSNCHKLPANRFVRRRLSVEEIVDNYTLLLHTLHAFSPNLKIIFTVSPIRHWKDGAHENNVSKSTLLLAIDSLQKSFDSVHYFPAYEIQLDELRDYRFYASDMLHPSEVAVDYIWQRFAETYFSKETIQLKKRLESFSAQMAHRPLHPETDEHSRFIHKLEQQRLQLKAEFPFLEGVL